MGCIQVNVLYPDGRVEAHDMELDTIRIGSDGHCEVRLPQDESAGEHVVVTRRDGVLMATARAADPPATLDGALLTEARLGPDSVIEIGRLRITLRAPENGEEQGASRKMPLKLSPVTAAGILVALPVLLFLVLSGGPRPDVRVPREVPPLWPQATYGCEGLEKDQALAAGQEKQIAAEGKRERSPFHIEDGVQAVPLFEHAAACYSAAGQSGWAAEMKEAAAKLRGDLTDQYKAHRVRLEHALRIKDSRMAQREVRVLLAMLAGQQGSYVAWLSNRDRQLSLELGKGKER